MAEPTDTPKRWREDDPSGSPEARRRRSQRRWALALVLVSAALVGAVLVFLSWLRPLPHAELAALEVGPPAGLRAPAWAARDREALDHGNLFPRTADAPAGGLGREELTRKLAALAAGPGPGVLVVHLSGYAERRGGEVHLLPADADPAGDRDADSATLRDVLRALAANPARNKLLVLDLSAPPPDLRRGFLDDDVASAVPAELEAVPDPARLTLCPCSPGQVPVAMDDLRRSAFGYYLERGLRGAADGAVDGTRDRVVSARELAAYVRSRVERWAWRNREARQTPEIYGPPGDFSLVSVAGDAPPPESAAPPAAYPGWLSDGWKARQRLWDGEGYRVGPPFFRLTEALLLEAERDWFEGTDEGRGAENLKAELARLEKRLAPLPAPDLPSLGAQTARGRKPDPKTVETVRAALDPARVPAPAPPPAAPAPAVSPEALAALKDQDPFDVAAAVFQAATEDADPRPERLRTLDAFLRALQPQPLFAETVLLRRLAERAVRTGGSAWPAGTVRRALDVARQGEPTYGDVQAAPQVLGQLEVAAQRRYEGEALLFAGQGYAAPEEADRAFQAAAEAYDAARRSLDAVQQAQKTLDRAQAILPAYAPYLEWAAAPQKEWEQAVEAASVLADQLDSPAPTDGAAVLRRNEELLRSSDDVAAALARLLRPFGAEQVAQLRERVRRPQAQASVLLEAEAALATPFLTAEDRGPLWDAARALARRLHDETVRLDQAEDPRHAPAPPPLAGSSPGPEAQEASRRRLALRRARFSLALLHLGGMGKGDLKQSEESLARAEAASGDAAQFRPAEEALAGNLRRAWADLDSRLRASSADPAVRDRLSRVWLPVGPAAGAADAVPTPRAELRARRVRELTAWRADRARYETRDLATLGALPDWLARFDRDAARALPPAEPERPVEVYAEPAALRFTPAQDAATTTLEVRGLGPAPANADATFRFLTPDDEWFTLTATAPGQTLSADRSLRLPAAASLAVPLRIALRSGRDGAVPPPAGILAQVRVGGRAYHRLIPVALREVADRLEVFLSASPSGEGDPLDELRLRPIAGRQSYFLFVRNPSPRPRNLTVRLADGNGPVPGGEAKLALRANETLPVHFSPPPPALKVDAAAPAPAPAPAARPQAEAELPELKGPLEVRLLDADAGDAVPEIKKVPVDIALAAEYAQVTGVRFTPAAPKDGGPGARLTVSVRAAPGLTGPPCPVELVLPGTGEGGRAAARKGTFHGELPADGGELTLSAEGVLPAPGAEDEGLVYLTVDGRRRAYVFRTTFVRNGDAVTPRAETRPALRLRAAPAALAGPHFEAGVEADNAPPGATLEVSLGQFRDGRFETDLVRRFPSPQKGRIGFAPAGADGALAFEASVTDWVAVFDARRIVGRRQLRARLLDRDGAEVRTAFQPVALDDGDPEDVTFVDPPRRARKDGTLTLTASGRSASGIAQASFFLGRPVDKKPLPNADLTPGRPADPDKTAWTVALPLKADKAGPIDVSVQFVNGAGLSSFATVAVELTDADPDKDKPGKIEGTVYEGAVAQPDLEVVLRDDKGAEKGRTKTNADGKFAFEKLPPGPYSLTVEKSATKRQGRANVVVEPEKTATAEIKLLMR
jgi:hypothetical protein